MMLWPLRPTKKTARERVCCSRSSPWWVAVLLATPDSHDGAALQVVIGLGNKLFQKFQTGPMCVTRSFESTPLTQTERSRFHYPYFLNLMTTFIYIPISFAYILPHIHWRTGVITDEMRAIPQKALHPHSRWPSRALLDPNVCAISRRLCRPCCRCSIRHLRLVCHLCGVCIGFLLHGHTGRVRCAVSDVLCHLHNIGLPLHPAAAGDRSRRSSGSHPSFSPVVPWVVVDACLGALRSMRDAIGHAAAAWQHSEMFRAGVQAAIPISMVVTKIWLQAKYSYAQYAGAFIVICGIVVVLWPSFADMGDGGASTMVWSAVMVFSCVPMCLSSVYKEKTLGDMEVPSMGACLGCECAWSLPLPSRVIRGCPECSWLFWVLVAVHRSMLSSSMGGSRSIRCRQGTMHDEHR